MDRTRLLKLLQDIELRTQRIDAYIGLIGRDRIPGLFQALSDLRMEARRQQAKLDDLKPSAVDDLRHLIAAIQRYPSHEAMQVTIPGSGAQRVRVGQALEDDARGLTHLVFGIAIGLNQISPGEVEKIVPNQKTAAFQFTVLNDRVDTIDQPLRAAERTAAIAAAALDILFDQGDYIIEDLKQSNASPRLRNAFQKMHDTLKSHANIVQVGLMNQSCSRILTAQFDELSSTLFAQLRSHIEGVSSALAQFPDWQQYSENAISVDIDKGSLDELTSSALSLAKHLQEDRSATSSVPQALETVVAWVKESDKPDRRDVLGLVRTLENLWSVVTKGVFALAKDIKSEGSKIVARAVLAGMLAAVGFNFAAAVGKIPGAEWLETTISYLRANNAPVKINGVSRPPGPGSH